MNVLVTGADGFAGSWLVRRLLDLGHTVTGTFRPSDDHRAERFGAEVPDRLTWRSLELSDAVSVQEVSETPWDAVAHLAAVSWVSLADRDPGRAWNDNAGGTARLMRALGDVRRAGGADPLVLIVSSLEVYGRGGPAARRETDPVAPVSSYAASKVGAEVVAAQEGRRAGLRVVVVRPSPHSGRGQAEMGFIPRYAGRIVTARKIRAPAIPTGLLDGVRDFLHVADVVDAYTRLLTGGTAGETYNVSSGEGVVLKDVVIRLCALAGWQPILEVDSADIRPDTVPHLVGDGAKLRAATGWSPRHTLDEVLQDVLDAQAN
ncbi:MAG TPA: GDP-mannose 4,6-dehydratase [Gemmatimonadales bacterium]|nr:GDP-mannose 4,6-dehydratase [Gemmatimonadales bacterium]